MQSSLYTLQYSDEHEPVAKRSRYNYVDGNRSFDYRDMMDYDNDSALEIVEDSTEYEPFQNREYDIHSDDDIEIINHTMTSFAPSYLSGIDSQEAEANFERVYCNEPLVTHSISPPLFTSMRSTVPSAQIENSIPTPALTQSVSFLKVGISDATKQLNPTNSSSCIPMSSNSSYSPRHTAYSLSSNSISCKSSSSELHIRYPHFIPPSISRSAEHTDFDSHLNRSSSNDNYLEANGNNDASYIKLLLFPDKVIHNIMERLDIKGLESLSLIHDRFLSLALSLPKKINVITVETSCERTMDKIFYEFYLEWIREINGIVYIEQDNFVVRANHHSEVHHRAMRLFRMITANADVKEIDLLKGADFLYEWDDSLLIKKLKRLTIRDCTYCTQDQIIDFVEQTRVRELYLSTVQFRNIRGSGYAKIVRPNRIVLDKQFFENSKVKRLFELCLNGVEFRAGMTQFLKMDVCRRLNLRPISMQPKDTSKMFNRMLKQFIEGKRAIFHIIFCPKQDKYQYDREKVSEGLNLKWSFCGTMYKSFVDGDWGRLTVTCSTYLEAKLDSNF